MRLLLVHNYYRQPGGEDAVFEAEKAMLEEMGHEVVALVEDNARLIGMSRLSAAGRAVWSREVRAKLRGLIRETRPMVAHFHNTFLMVSPAAYSVCKEAGVPVVQTLHNYRLLCPPANFFRNGGPCEDCLGRLPWPGVLHACWRGSRAETAVVTMMLAVHRLLKTWAQQVDLYIALTEFARQKFVEGGLPARKIFVKPNFVYPDPGEGPHRGNYALFVGRLSPEKGLRTLLSAWQLVKTTPLKVVGDGLLRRDVERFVAREGLSVDVLGRRPREEVFRLMRQARALVFPSEWYEGFPVTIVEAFACGLPVLASRLGAMAEIVEDGRTGLLCNPGDPEDLAAKVEWAWSHPQAMTEMGREARREYEEKYTAERNYELLMQIYERAMREK